jgi:PPM family protein phosphatase
VSRRALPFRPDVAGATHIGNRRANDDHYAFDEALGLLAVADGVSGRPAGRVAAEAAISALLTYLTDPSEPLIVDARERVVHAVAHVHRRVREQAAADDDLHGMATTLAFVVEHGDLLAVGHVGDSRVLRFRDGRLQRLTVDHRLKHDVLVRERLPPDALESYGPDTLTRAIGLGESVQPDVYVETLHPNDGILVTTDGLTCVVDEATIAATLHDHPDSGDAVDMLVRLALASGAPDNLALVYGRWRVIGA